MSKQTLDYSVLAAFYLALALLPVNNALGQDDLSPLWEKVGRWEVRVDETLDYGCFAVIIESERFFRFGINNSTSTVYAIIGEVGWDSIEAGKSYDILVEFDREGAWDVPSYGVDFSGIKGLAFEVGDYVFIEEMMERHSMHVRYQGEEIMRMSMAGSIKAVQSLGACMEVFDPESSGSADNTDPFSSSSEDPFAPNY